MFPRFFQSAVTPVTSRPLSVSIYAYLMFLKWGVRRPTCSRIVLKWFPYSLFLYFSHSCICAGPCPGTPHTDLEFNSLSFLHVPFCHISMEADYFNIYKASLLISILTKICVLLYLVADFQNFRFWLLQGILFAPSSFGTAVELRRCCPEFLLIQVMAGLWNFIATVGLSNNASRKKAFKSQALHFHLACCCAPLFCILSTNRLSFNESTFMPDRY